MPIGTFLAVLRGEDPDAMTQVQREALIDIGLWMAAADGEISAAERKTIHEKASSMRWQSEMPLSKYIERAAQKAREFDPDPEAHAAYLADIVERLATPRARKHALQAIKRFAKVDGEYAEEERHLVEEFEKAIAAAE